MTFSTRWKIADAGNVGERFKPADLASNGKKNSVVDRVISRTKTDATESEKTNNDGMHRGGLAGRKRPQPAQARQSSETFRRHLLFTLDTGRNEGKIQSLSFGFGGSWKSLSVNIPLASDIRQKTIEKFSRIVVTADDTKRNRL